MKNIFASAFIYLCIALFACQDGKESSAPSHNIASYQNIGHQIPLETGQRWMETYNLKNNIQGRGLLSSYSISASLMTSTLASVPNLIGVAFHHATDDLGFHHFIAIPIEESLSVWASIDGKLYVDANTNTTISEQTAKRWTQNYKTDNPNAIWFHFFGKNVFDDITAISYFTDVEIEPAINDENLTPQLLLIIEDETLLGGILGRTEDTSDPVVYDASSPCPPCPVN